MTSDRQPRMRAMLHRLVRTWNRWRFRQPSRLEQRHLTFQGTTITAAGLARSDRHVLVLAPRSGDLL